MRIIDTGLVYRNPRPELRAVHAWRPTIIRFEDGELLCAFELAQADVALDRRAYVSRSTDGGATWSAPARVLADAGDRPTTHSVRISRLSDGSAVALGSRVFRDDPEKGVVNAPSLGYAEMELVLLRSSDRGRTWEGPHRLDPPLEGPAFEICHAIIELRDGRWLAPTSTWMGWAGDAPNGMKAVALVSADGGKTWPTYMVVFDRWAEGIVHWEQSMLALDDRRLLSVAWAVDSKTNETLPTPYAISSDGRSFSIEGLTGFRAQISKLARLPDGRILAVYRRHDEPGLWATTARISGTTWTNLETHLLWRGSSGMAGSSSLGVEMSQLRFGYPQMVLEPDGSVFLVFWCEEDCIKNIRWMRLSV